MGCRDGEFPGNESPCSPSSSSSASSTSEDLLYATLCLIGLHVDVQVRDGSVYSGVFHTASLENGFNIVLKKARMTNKGKGDSNIADDVVVETLVILSRDLVQIVAKGVKFSDDGCACSLAGNNAEAVVDSFLSEECPVIDDGESIKSAVSMKNSEQIRSSVQSKNELSRGLVPTNARKEGRNFPEIKETSGAAVDGRQCGNDELREDKNDDEKELEFPEEDNAIKVLGKSSSSDADVTQIKPDNVRPTAMTEKLLHSRVSSNHSPPRKMENHFSQRTTSADDSPYVVSSSVSTSTSPVVDVTSESCSKSVATSTEALSPHFSQSNNRSPKEVKLDPDAKVFTTSFMDSESAASLPAVQTVAGTGSYMPNHSSVALVPAVQSEVGLSSVGSHSSIPVKSLPHDNFPPGNVATTSQFSPPPIVGRGRSRMRPRRRTYAGQYPRRAHDGQYPMEAHDGQYPMQAHDGQYTMWPHAGQYPMQAHDGQYPLQPHAGQYPMQPYAGQYPMQPYAGQYPMQSHAGQYPMQAHDGQYTMQPHAGQYPMQPHAGQYPMQPHAPHVGQYPMQPHAGQYPMQPHAGQYLMQPHAGQYPMQPHAGQYAFQVHAGQYPMQAHAGQYSMQPDYDQYPMQPDDGQYPMQPHAGQYPFQPHAGQYPTQTYLGQYPSQMGSGIVHPNSHSELVPSPTTIPTPFAYPVVFPHQAQSPKNQGTAAVQATQQQVSPPPIASEEQPHAKPCPIPTLQLPDLSNQNTQVQEFRGRVKSKSL
ncbi:Ataxin 2, SM domain containing protein [Trema orientale]|uniref:Ataxin 2, SM domain containing protein n=1 Tax=Trema orientale TaxID=63057 RepID=A0A2P5FK18_TREOI|nr:Ataxin 2, SM domain containing protein [Trema orientale]